MNQHLYSKEDKELFQAIGSFVVNFEFITAEMKNILLNIMKSGGLVNSVYFKILTYDSTARPLLDYMKGFLREGFSGELNDPLTNKFFDKLFKEITHSIEKRNEVVHAQWYMDIIQGDLLIENGDFVVKNGDYASEEISNLTAIKYKIKKSGIENIYENVDINMIETLKRYAWEFQGIAMTLNIIASNILENNPLTETIVTTTEM